MGTCEISPLLVLGAVRFLNKKKCTIIYHKPLSQSTGSFSGRWLLGGGKNPRPNFRSEKARPPQSMTRPHGAERTTTGVG